MRHRRTPVDSLLTKIPELEWCRNLNPGPGTRPHQPIPATRHVREMSKGAGMIVGVGVHHFRAILLAAPELKHLKLDEATRGSEGGASSTARRLHPGRSAM
jgi:hypothetical protein